MATVPTAKLRAVPDRRRSVPGSCEANGRYLECSNCHEVIAVEEPRDSGQYGAVACACEVKEMKLADAAREKEKEERIEQFKKGVAADPKGPASGRKK